MIHLLNLGYILYEYHFFFPPGFFIFSLMMENVQQYIIEMKKIQINLLNFLDSVNDIEENFDNLSTLLEDLEKKKKKNQHKLKTLLHMIVKIYIIITTTDHIFSIN